MYLYQLGPSPCFYQVIVKAAKSIITSAQVWRGGRHTQATWVVSAEFQHK